MLTKILFTLAVIVAVLGVVRFRQQRGSLVSQQQPRLVNPPRRNRMPIGWLASGAILVMLVASSLLIYDYWQDRHTVITVRVINATNQQATTYRAYRGDVENREFVTVDGTRVVLAETERLETFIRSRDQN